MVFWQGSYGVTGRGLMSDQEDFFESVLLVEDDSGHALLIRRALKGLVGEVVHVDRMDQALTTLSDRSFSFIITDLNLPDRSGVNHIAELLSASKATPVIVLTSSAALRDAVEAMKLGARDYIVKTFDDDFREVLALALARLNAQIQLEEERTRLAREMNLLRVAIENSNDCLGVIDRSGTIIYGNAALSSFLSHWADPPKEVVGIFSDRLDKSEIVRSSFEANLRDLASGEAWHTELSFKASQSEQGSKRDDLHAFDLSLARIQDADSESGECVLWIRDITEQKRKDKFQREILSTTTHDLKGPLGAIVVSAEMLTDMVTEAGKVRDLVVRIASAAQGAVNLIDEFLSARRIQEGTFILRPASQDAAELINEVIENHRSIAVARDIELIEELPTDRLEASVDRLGFMRVLGNLLSNALKFTGKGGTITVRANQLPGELCVEVQDTGSGMEPAEVKKVFERFARLDRHSTVAGSGIGLFVVKSIVAAHGGAVDVKSKMGQGTVFQVRFPADPPVNSRGELISLDFA